MFDFTFQISRFQTRRPEPALARDVTFFHPDTDQQYASGVPVSATHPDIQRFLQDVLPPSHPDVMEMLRNPAENPLPGGWHPRLSRWQNRLPEPMLRHNVSFYHPNVTEQYAAGVGIDISKHPSIQRFLEDVLPERHPNVDAVLADPSDNPLPDWHPAPERFQSRLPEPSLVRDVTFYHPDVDVEYSAGGGTSLTHPSIHDFLLPELPPTHPNVDAMLRAPGANPLPDWHPRLSRFQRRGNAITRRHTVSAYHPDPDQQFAAGVAVSSHHPSMQAFFGDLVPPTHPDVDDILRNPRVHAFPTWHPRLSTFQLHKTPVAEVVGVPPDHPNATEMYQSGQEVPSRHPYVHNMLAEHLPDSHPSIDEVLRNPVLHPLPHWHVSINTLLNRGGVGFNRNGDEMSTLLFNTAAVEKPSLAHDHPDIEAAYAAGEPFPENHPSIHWRLQVALPVNHPDIDAVLRDTAAHPLPSWHPKLGTLVTRRSIWSPGLILLVFVALWFALLALARRRKLFHRRMSPMELHTDMPVKQRKAFATAATPTFRADATLGIPTGRSLVVGDRVAVAGYECEGVVRFVGPHHTTGKQRIGIELDEDVGLNDGTVQGHQYFTCDRGDFGGSPGVLVKPSKVTLLTADEAGYLEISVDPESSEIRRRRTPTEAGSATETTTNDALFFQSPPSGERLPARDLEERKRLQRHAQHCTSDPMYVPEDVTAPPQVGQWTNSALELEPRSNNLARFVLQRAMETRMPLFKIWLGSWTTGNVLFVVVYAALNIAALLVSDHSADRGLGTLAAANTMLLVVPATRNNVLTLLLGLPFDRVVLHHRFLGRATITIVFAHFIMYLDQLMARISEHLYWTGL